MSNIAQKNEKIQVEMRKIAKNLLEKGEVDAILGYSKGTIPLSTSPILIKKKQDFKDLVWNNFCYVNLASYISSSLNTFFEINKDNVKVGIIAKGCTARALIHLSIENQINLENIRIIGIACDGVINRRKIEKEFSDKEITDAYIENDYIVIKGLNLEEKVPYEDYINTLCKSCKVKAPPNSEDISDKLFGEVQDINNIEDEFQDLIEFESLSPDEKWNHITELLEDCNRCYACREACPLCYCNLCFIDQNMPTWFDKTYDLSDIMVFHLIRALHLAGRCVACGACSSVCPMGIDLNLITRKLEKLVKERFNFTTGLNLSTVPPMMDFKMKDNEDFMLEET